MKKLIEFIVETVLRLLGISLKEQLHDPEMPTTETDDERESLLVGETIISDGGIIKSGERLVLKEVSLYVSSTAKTHSSIVSGVYWAWDDQIVRSRLRITNLPERVGVEKQVTGWINVSAVQTENAGSETLTEANTRAAFIETAVSQKGYSVGTYKVNKYTRWYTNDENPHEWCGMFVVWCARNAGVDASVIPKSAYVPYFQDYYLANPDRCYPAVSPLVKGGDLIFYDWNNDGSADHIAIVEAVDSEYIYTVEGNVDPYSVVTRKRSRGDERIYMLASPF